MQRRQAAIAAFAVLALLFLLYLRGYGHLHDLTSSEDRRALRASATLSVYLIGSRWAWASSHGRHRSYSVFTTELLRRYGTGRLDYVVRRYARCDRACHGDEQAGEDPCLAVAVISGPERCSAESLRCGFPRCRTMVTSDERCEHGEYDVREYRSTHLPGGRGYLPLGPRYDSWTSLEEIRRDVGARVKAASERRFAFNAIFTRSTDAVRMSLAAIVEAQRGRSTHPTFVKISKFYEKDVNDVFSNHISTDSYMRILLESIFTLAPAGHNPECYRLYEAAEAGSIPVLFRGDFKRKLSHDFQCRGSLDHWRDAPVVVLDSWEDLYPTIEGLMADPQRLDDMQVKLRAWYDGYLRRVVAEFEDYILKPDLPIGINVTIPS